MCGIVAVIGSREAAPLLLDGLRQLEYRGYDSAGIATIELSVAGAAPPVALRSSQGQAPEPHC